MTTNATAPAEPPALKFHPDFDLARADAIRTTLARAVAGEKPIARNGTSYGARSITVDGADALEFIGVTEPVARDGDIVRVDGIQLTALAADPVMLWSHDYEGKRPPIGRIISTNRETDATLGRIFTFRAIPALIDDVDHEHLDFVRLLWGYYKKRFLNSVSYGWRIVEARPIMDGDNYVVGLEHTLSEALEFSGCNVGSDRHAVQRLIQEHELPEKYVGRFMGQAFRNAPAYEIRETPPAGFVWRTPEVPAVAAPVVEPVKTDTPAAPAPEVQPGMLLVRAEDIHALIRAEFPKALQLLAETQARKGAEISQRNRTVLEGVRTHLTTMRDAADAALASLGDVLKDGDRAQPEEATPAAPVVEEDRAVVVADAPASPIVTAIDDLTRTVRGPSLLDAIDDLTKPRVSETQRKFDDVLAGIAARATGAGSAAHP